MVSAGDGGWLGDPQDVGGRAGAQAADRALASGARRRRARRCTAASRRLIEEPADVCRPKLWLRSHPLGFDGLAMTVRGGGVPRLAMASMPQMGPPPRSFAADAHACIM